MWVYMWVCAYEEGILGVSDPLELQLQKAVSYMKWVQGPELRPPRRGEGSFKGPAIFPTPSIVLKQMFFINFGICP